MEYYEARSVKEIKLMLKKQGYASKGKIRDHLSFLENLADKINRKIRDEQALGGVAWSEKEDLKKVHEVFSNLALELNKAELNNLDKESKPKGWF